MKVDPCNIVILKTLYVMMLEGSQVTPFVGVLFPLISYVRCRLCDFSSKMFSVI